MKKRVTNTHYILDGVKYDRVTSVLGFLEPPKLVEWKLRQAESCLSWKAKSKEACDIGKKVHKQIERYFKMGNFSPRINTFQEENCLSAFKKWIAYYDIEPLWQEKLLIDEENKVAGTCDFFGILKEPMSDTLILLDWKTSKYLNPTYWIQVNLYAYLMVNGYPVTGFVDKVGILRLDKYTGEFEYKVQDYDQKKVDMFYNLLEYVRYIKGEINNE